MLVVELMFCVLCSCVLCSLVLHAEGSSSNCGCVMVGLHRLALSGTQLDLVKRQLAQCVQ